LVDKSNASEMTLIASDLHPTITSKNVKIDQYKFSTGSVEMDLSGTFKDRVITFKMEGTEDCLQVTLNGKGTAKLTVPFEVKMF
jgi:hypothetical protein